MGAGQTDSVRATICGVTTPNVATRRLDPSKPRHCNAGVSFLVRKFYYIW